MARNAYFRPDIRPDGVFLQFFPPVDGGEKLTVKEVTAYLQANNFTAFDLKALNNAILDETGSAEVKVSSPVSFFINESMALDVSPDQMELRARFYPNSDKGSRLTKESILTDLHYKQIRFGIREKEIEKFLAEREYCKSYLIAAGKAPRNGSDASIEYFFNTNLNLKPKTNDDGSVDFHNLDIISKVKEGQLLARLTPADPGDVGADVFGTVIKPLQVKSLRLEFGRNIRLSEDQTEIYSEVTGHASLTGGRVFVSNVYEVAADVDNSTGDIDFPGSVHVKGNIKSGFSVKAKGDVIIDGVVEGAKVYSEGQIIVRAGIHGMGKGSLVAKSNIVCKFIENATARSEEGYIAADSIIHSIVEAHSEIRVSGKKGNITGGSAKAGIAIDVNYLGTEMEAPTEVEVGVSPETMKRYTQLIEEGERLDQEITKVKPILAGLTAKIQGGQKLDPKKVQYVQVLAQQYKTLTARMKEIHEELTGFADLMRESAKSKVVVHRTAFAGVTIKIGSASTTLKSKRDYCQYVYEGGEVKATVL